MFTETQKADALSILTEALPPGTTVYTCLRHVSASGMTRYLDLYYISDNTPHWITYSASILLGSTYSNRYDAMSVRGAGMDMGFHTVYSLSRALHGDGYALNHRWL